MAQNIAAHLIETINKLVRVSRRLPLDLGGSRHPRKLSRGSR
jgi:hypothetical protein